MAEQPSSDEQPERRRGKLRTQCTSCEGGGSKIVPRMGESRTNPGIVVTVLAPFGCRDCGGSGWLDCF